MSSALGVRGRFISFQVVAAECLAYGRVHYTILLSINLQK